MSRVSHAVVKSTGTQSFLCTTVSGPKLCCCSTLLPGSMISKHSRTPLHRKTALLVLSPDFSALWGKGRLWSPQAAGETLLMLFRDVTWGDEAEEGRGACTIDARLAATGKTCSLLWCHIVVVTGCYLVVLPLAHWNCS